MNSITTLQSLGQSLWYDNIQRKLLENGELKAMIDRGEIRGVTSNPSIFQKAIAKSNDYDSALVSLAWANWDAERIFWQLAIEDIQAACDLFKPLYEKTVGGDGYVSLEVSPYLAHDTEKTAEQAKLLWERVDRPNLMIKIPATQEGIPAIRQAIAAGINVNVTLIFSLVRYDKVMDAFLSGLEDRVAANQAISQIASVASFFVSRVDTKVDGWLPDDSPLRGQAAIANAKLAYAAFEKVFTSSRFHSLQARFSARVQRPLWASTSTKNPTYPDTMYVDNLIGPDTVNTVPPVTLVAFRDHGKPNVTVTRGLEDAQFVLADLESEGISMDVVTQELEDEGVKSFADAFTGLLETIDERRKKFASSLGSLAASVSERIAKFEADSVPSRLWAHDPTLWTKDPKSQAEVKIRMGWLDAPELPEQVVNNYRKFADQIHYEGIVRILLLGMGGSSLAPEVLSYVFASTDSVSAEGKPCLSILDSTDPAQVAQAAKDFPPEKSLYVIASKSGGTAEVMAMLEYFWQLSGQDGSRFIAITDPGTSLAKLAVDRGFRKGFYANPEVGGRYSALTAFGLVPAALLGLDLRRLLERAVWMRNQSLTDVPAGRNPGLALGAVIAESALAGRDKLTILADVNLLTVGSWLEQLIAESSGKQGKGIVPVDREPVGELSIYGDDRLFVYLRQDGEHDGMIQKLREAGHPALEFQLSDPYDLGAEFFRWEVAIAIACHVLAVNAFDQPNVQDSKDRTKAKIAEFQKKGKLSEGKLVEPQDAAGALRQFLAQAEPGMYIAINAYMPRLGAQISALQDFRKKLRDKTRCAITLGFGPRFQHSTGQLHKGGPDNGLFLQFVVDAEAEIEIPMQKMTFGTLERAQALGDFEALVARDRKVLRVHLTKDWQSDLMKLAEAFEA